MFDCVEQPAQIPQAAVLPMWVFVRAGLLVWDGREEWETG